ncbi:MAG: hypothetical protein IJ161_00130 [Bacteroidales bacterium]|nr:hypothetical protein [Bacteroidales bacterium]
MKILKSMFILSGLLAGGIATAQNLNPTVEVTNEYEGKLMEVHKPLQEMAVPDSLMRFDLDFDYSVFETKYAGAADFAPYLMEMRPQREVYTGRKLFVKAGAGLALKTFGKVVFSPEIKGPFYINIGGDHSGYFGKYHYIDQYSLKRSDSDPKTYSGYDMANSAGVAGGYDWVGGGLSFNVGYEGIHTKSFLTKTGMNLFGGTVQLASNTDEDRTFLYAAKADVKFGKDSYEWNNASLGLLDVNFEGTFGPRFNYSNSILADVAFQYNLYNGQFDAKVGQVAITPKYVYSSEYFRASLGVRFAYVFNSGDPYMGFQIGKFNSQIFYPDVRIDYQAVPGKLNLFAAVTGKDVVNSYTSIKRNFHFFNAWMGMNVSPLLDNTRIPLRAEAGLEGNFSSKFRYHLSGGYSRVRNGLLDAMLSDESGVTYQKYNLIFGDLRFAYDGKPVLVDGGLDVNVTDIYKKERTAFEPAKFSGDLRVRYNYRDRIIGGIFAEGASARRGHDMGGYELKIPGFVNLGLQAEFAFSRKISFWAEAGNLLNMNIQRHPMYSDPGLSLIGGIILNL